jgi:hypothetical protein
LTCYFCPFLKEKSEAGTENGAIRLADAASPGPLRPKTESGRRPRGDYAATDDLINHALEAVNADADLTAEEKARFDGGLDERMAEFTQGEGVSGVEAR